MSYANVKAFILILVVMAVPAAIRAAPFGGGFQAPAIPAVPMPGMQTPFTGRDSLAGGQAQMGGSSAFRGPMSAQNLQGASRLTSNVRIAVIEPLVHRFQGYRYWSEGFHRFRTRIRANGRTFRFVRIWSEGISFELRYSVCLICEVSCSRF